MIRIMLIKLSQELFLLDNPNNDEFFSYFYGKKMFEDINEKY